MDSDFSLYKTPESSPPTTKRLEKIPKIDLAPPLPPDPVFSFCKDEMEMNVSELTSKSFPALPVFPRSASESGVQFPRKSSVDASHSSFSLGGKSHGSMSAYNSGMSTPRSLSMSPFRFLQHQVSAPSSPKYSAPASPKRENMSHTFLNQPVLFQQCIGNGGEARIFAADIQGCGVAIKMYHQLQWSHAELEAKKQWICALSNLHHDNLLKVFGHRFIDHPLKNEHYFAMVTEKMDGSLKSYVHGLSQGKLETWHHLITPSVLHGWFIQIVAGLHFMHTCSFFFENTKNQGLWHRDLKCENVLYRRQCNVFEPFLFSETNMEPITLKLADFDTVGNEQTGAPTQNNIGTTPFMAPEMFSTQTLKTEKVDIWSLGMVLYELLTLRIPYEGYAFLDLCTIVPQGVRPSFPSEASFTFGLEWEFWHKLFRECTEKNPEKRPSAAQVLEKLQDYIQAEI